MDQLHGVGGGEGRPAGQHLVERGAEGVEIGAVVDGPVHAPGLLGGEVGQRPLETLGAGRFAVDAGEPGGDAEVGDLHRRQGEVDDDVRRVEVLVDHVGVVDLAQGAGQGDGQAEEGLGGHASRADHRAQRHAAEVLEDQPDAVLEPFDPQGADDAVERQALDDAVLVGEPGDLLRRRVLALEELDDDR